MIEKSQCNYNFNFKDSQEDWLYKVDEDNKTIVFNCFIAEICQGDYYLSIIIHELFHFIVQKINYKSEVKHIKSTLGDFIMQTFNIEADLYTSKYYKEYLNYELDDFIKVLYDGRSTFASEEFKIGKLNRFLGSIVSIINFYSTNTYRIFLPHFEIKSNAQNGEINLNNQITIFVTNNNSHSMLYVYRLDSDLKNILQAFNSTVTMKFDEYLKIVKTFCDGIKIE
ncbi:MAG: hypothetical protein IPM92_11040 [Saprospiraceae bacterium]|nr:hypothetical protein [Saprospiraceae bacterium]